MKFFERAASDFPRSDYRPPWLYWSGRSHEELKERELAEERYALVTCRLRELVLRPPRGQATRRSAPAAARDRRKHARLRARRPSSCRPTRRSSRRCITAGLYDDALNELRYAQRTSGDSPAIQATMAWILHAAGAHPRRVISAFPLLRGAITAMSRAYPQFLAAGGEQLPREILQVIFPLRVLGSDPQVRGRTRSGSVSDGGAGLQESTFAPDVRSVANAVGLMQLMPATARQQARKLKMTYSARLLTDPEANVRMGMAYFSEKMKEFGAPASRARQLQRRRKRRAAMDGGEAGTRPAKSSSTTSRIRRRRTTSNGFSGPQRTTERLYKQ